MKRITIANVVSIWIGNERSRDEETIKSNRAYGDFVVICGGSVSYSRDFKDVSDTWVSKHGCLDNDFSMVASRVERRKGAE